MLWRPVLLISVLLLVRCDSALPTGQSVLVVEAFLESDAPLPKLVLRETRPLNRPYPLDGTTAVQGADVTLWLDAESVTYRPDGSGRYAPSRMLRASPRLPARLEARWQDQRVTAESTIPPHLALDSVTVRVPSAPVDGIILDSLFIDPQLVDSLRLDSLRTGAAQGLVYLIEVTAHWRVAYAETGADSAYWIHTQLRHDLQGSRRLDDFFLRPEQLFRERAIRLGPRGERSWTGVYAIPVEAQAVPVPKHLLRVAVVRTTQAYARFVSGTRDPQRREPPGNIEGGIGIFVGVSVDSQQVMVE